MALGEGNNSLWFDEIITQRSAVRSLTVSDICQECISNVKILLAFSGMINLSRCEVLLKCMCWLHMYVSRPNEILHGRKIIHHCTVMQC